MQGRKPAMGRMPLSTAARHATMRSRRASTAASRHPYLAQALHRCTGSQLTCGAKPPPSWLSAASQQRRHRRPCQHPLLFSAASSARWSLERRALRERPGRRTGRGEQREARRLRRAGESGRPGCQAFSPTTATSAARSPCRRLRGRSPSRRSPLAASHSGWLATRTLLHTHSRASGTANPHRGRPPASPTTLVCGFHPAVSPRAHGVPPWGYHLRLRGSHRSNHW